MSAASSLSSSLNNPVTKQSSTPDAFSALSTGQFLKVILTELNQQDPLQPNDTSKMLEQISNLRSIQSNADLQTKLGTLVAQNQLASAGGLLGKTVSGLSDTNQRVEDLVQSVTKTDSGAVLVTKKGWRIAFDKVESLYTAAATGSGS